MKILILSDIHANWAALQAVLGQEKADEILYLGDLVAYGPQPAECVEWARTELAPERVIQGNHDWAAASHEDPRCSPPYRVLSAATHRFTAERLDEGMQWFLGSLAPLRALDLGGSRFVACHAAPSEPFFYYLNTNRADVLAREVALAGQPEVLFFGHTHWPSRQRVGGTLVVNPGSVGQPKDSDPRASYAVWEDGEMELRRAAYDVEATVQAYDETPLDRASVFALAQVLRTGGSLPAPAEVLNERE